MAKGQESVEWLTGAVLDRQAREAAVSLEWQSAPLRDRLNQLARRQRISVFLDRRIDGSQEMRLSVNNVSFEELLCRLCDQLNAGMCRVDDVYYIGPEASAAALPDQVQQLKDRVAQCRDARVKRKWQRARPMDLERLSEPKTAIERLCRNVNCELAGLEQVPHDLWDHTETGGAALVTRLMLLLVGFEKTIQLDDQLKQARVVAQSPQMIITREFNAGKKVKAFQRMIAKAFPAIEIETGKRSLTVRGTADQVWSIQRMLIATQKPKVPEVSSQRFTLKTADKRGTILASVANQLSRQFKYEPSQLIHLNARVELELTDASVDELIVQTLKGSGLRYRLTDELLEILDE